jgi:NarL family two-component system sensor histidine kinase LiaS
LRQLAQNALAEMRALLLELHPSSLTNTSLGELIHQIAEITINRSGLKISIHIEHQDPIPADVHFALYRVIQESLNNIVLHALASHVDIYFDSYEGHVDMIIQDNGIGFDLSGIDIGHLGLQIMRDRIQNIGGDLEIVSHKDNGSRIKVSWTNPAP